MHHFTALSRKADLRGSARKQRGDESGAASQPIAFARRAAITAASFRVSDVSGSSTPAAVPFMIPFAFAQLT